MAANSTAATLIGYAISSYPVSPITASITVVALALICWRMMASGLDPREPPEAISKIPFVGHLIGMFIYQIEYLEMLRSVVYSLAHFRFLQDQ
jgi:hypothetical protein